MLYDLINSFEVYLEGSRIAAFFTAYMVGVLVSFTPCVYPVIPIEVAYVGSHSQGSRWKGFLLSLIYVAGTALTYTVLGMVAALTGSLFGSIQTSPWTFFVVANVCILMGLSMLHVFHLQMPQFMHRMRHKHNRRDGIWGGFLLGIVSGLVLGPCTAPVLGALLAFVATKQNVVYGMALLFTFAFGMGTLMILAGTFSSFMANMPRSGEWMVKVQKAFGWILLAMGEYFLVMTGRFLI